jgi:hypothetical protein
LQVCGVASRNNLSSHGSDLSIQSFQTYTAPQSWLMFVIGSGTSCAVMCSLDVNNTALRNVIYHKGTAVADTNWLCTEYRNPIFANATSHARYLSVYWFMHRFIGLLGRPSADLRPAFHRPSAGLTR